MNALQSPTSQTREILANPFVSVPVVFSVKKTGSGLHLYHTFLDSTNASADDERVAGSIVVDPDVVGASAQVLACPGQVGTTDSQRLLIKTLGPQAPSQRKTLDFYPIFQGGRLSTLEDGSNLMLKISDGLIPPGVDANSIKGAADIPPIPLIVSPDSAAIGYIPPETLAKMNAVGIDWGGLLNVAKTVLPVVAKAGYQVYQQLSSNPAEEHARRRGADAPMFLGTLLSVAQLAVPIAGKLISALSGK